VPPQPPSFCQAAWVYVGVSVCSVHDQFVKATGREKALGRAFQQLQKGQGIDLMVNGAMSAVEVVADLKALLADWIVRKKGSMGVA